MEDLLLSDEIKKKAQEQYENLPHWHKKNPALLCNSLMEAKKNTPHLSALADSLLPKMPRMVRASQNLRAINMVNESHWETIERGISYPWISFDASKSRNCLLFDIDHSEGWELVRTLPGSIRPTLILDPHSCRSHAILPLKTPVLRGGKLSCEILADLAHKLLSKHLKATPLGCGSLIKNPFGRSDHIIGVIPRFGDPTIPLIWDMHDKSLAWHTIPGSTGAELKDIVSALADEYSEVTSEKTKKQFIHRGDPSYLSRNCYIFDLTRWWAYDNQETDGGKIMEKADEINSTLQQPLPFSEVKATAKSISRFMQTRYRPRSPLKARKGVMGLAGSDMDQKTKQKLSAVRTNDIRIDNTDHRLKQALKHWPENKKLTQKALSEVSGVPLRTVKRHWKNVT